MDPLTRSPGGSAPTSRSVVARSSRAPRRETFENSVHAGGLGLEHCREQDEDQEHRNANHGCSPGRGGEECRKFASHGPETPDPAVLFRSPGWEFFRVAEEY